MSLIDTLYEVYTAITVNKLRTGLTMLGIVIGIGSVISMVALGQGAQTAIKSNIEAMGSNLIMVRPGAQNTPGSQVRGAGGDAKTLTDADVAMLKSLPTLATVAPEISVGRKQVTSEGSNTNTSVTGVASTQAKVRNITLQSGTFISPTQESSYAKVAVVGPDVQTALFGTTSAVGKKIRIGSTSFTIIGVTAVRGSTGFGSSDDFIYVPLSTARQYMASDNFISTINTVVVSGGDMAAAATAITDALRKSHKLATADKADFSVMNQADIVSTASSVTGVFTTLLGAVAGISLLVGGIGIMNMMLTTVTERTREIGLRKAIGAKSRTIRLQFLIEAIVLTLLGGLLGVGLGFLGAWAATLFAIPSSVSASSIYLALGVSTAIGIIFGYYPAHRASKLSPIAALRYD